MSNNENNSQELVSGILEALPFGAVMLNHLGETVYANERAENATPPMDEIDLTGHTAVIDCLLGGESVLHRPVEDMEAGDLPLKGSYCLTPIRFESEIIGALFVLLPEAEVPPVPEPVAKETAASEPSVAPEGPEISGNLSRQRDDFTRQRIQKMLDIHGHTVEGKREAARQLGIGLSTLYRLMSDKGISGK